MSSGKITRHYRHHRRGCRKSLNVCLRCFQFGHQRRNCSNEPLVGCGKCTRAYFFTTECVCDNSNTDGMTLRMVGGETYQRPCIDILIGNRPFEAFFNQSRSIATISIEVLEHINSLRELENLPTLPPFGIFNHPIQRRKKIVEVELEVQKDQEIPVIIGMEILVKTGFQFGMDNVIVNERSPVIDTPKTIDFLYNMVQCNSLTKWMKSKNKPMYKKYKKGNEPSLKEEPRVIIRYEPLSDQPSTHETDADILELHANDENLDAL